MVPRPVTCRGLGQYGSLHTLDLKKCRGISDVSGLGQSLHTLDLSQCKGISDVSWLGQCSSLHTVHLSGCIGIRDVSGLGECGSLPVSYTHLRAHETPEHLVCRLLLEKKKKTKLCQQKGRY
eukprot:TRINITY_DN16274_c0_g2_i1.p1 TRINITY_DN16274_c0_g2~~TRINITY_DN16274_c0_g2_i1.p1  ORF type:complete len:122 (+),score=18.00 TRINITY_DN16274_c0_g2_i1:3-368(+)